MTPSNSALLIPILVLSFLLPASATRVAAGGFPTYGQNSRSFGNIPENMSIQTSPDMGKNIYLIDNLADQMVYRLSRDLKLSSPCPSGEALLRQMRRHAELTNELINAYRGKSDTSFQQAAAALNQSIKTLLELNRTARISEAISHMIHQSLPLISFVNQNAGHDSIGSKT